MSYAILSDIHANIEALRAVLEDLESFDCERLVCLGDVIGYGPDPRQALRIALEEFEFVIKGNHEHAVLFNPAGFNESATASAEWTRDRINDSEGEEDLRTKFWNFLGEMDEKRREGDVLYVHATPVDPTSQYLLPDDMQNSYMMEQIFNKLDRVSFGGHTHIPGVFEQDRDRFLEPDALDRTYTLNETKVHINVGSVGQPRDGDPRSSYVIVDGDDVHFRRVEYDVRGTARKILSIDQLSDSLGRRLLAGK